MKNKKRVDEIREQIAFEMYILAGLERDLYDTSKHISEQKDDILLTSDLETNRIVLEIVTGKQINIFKVRQDISRLERILCKLVGVDDMEV